jgi:hypothetical protein
MRFAILSLVAAGALALSAGSADARPPYYRGGNYHHNHYSYSRPYYGGYYGGYARPYYGGWRGYNSGFGFNVVTPRGVGISFSNGGVYPYFGGYYGNSYYRPYYGGWGYPGWRR